MTTSIWLLISLASQGTILEDKRLATVPPDVRLEGHQFSADGRAVTFWATTNEDRRIVYIEGKPGTPFPLVRIGSGHLAFQKVFSSDGKSIAYVGNLNGRGRVVVGDRPHPVYDEVRSLVFSPDGLRVAYEGRNDGRSFLVLDGQPKGLAYDVAHTPRFSPDGKSFTFLGGRNGTTRLVVDDKEVEGTGATTEPVWSPNGKTLAYATVQDGKTCVVIGSQTREVEFDRVEHLKLSADGRILSFLGTRAGKQQFVWGDRSGPVFDKIHFPVWGPDGLPRAYWGRERVNGKDLVFFVSGDQRSDGYLGIGLFVLSPDGKRSAHLAREDRSKVRVVLDGMPGEPFFTVSEMLFSQDGSSFAYLATDGAQHVLVLNGKREAQGAARYSRLTFCGDHKTLAYIVTEGPRSWVVVGDARSKEADGMGFLIPSPRGRTVAYTALRGGKAQLIVGDRESAAFDFIGTPKFNEDGSKITFGALRGREFWWKVQDVK